MMKTTFIATAIFALMVGGASAGEGNGEPFPNYAAGNHIVANQVLSDTGSEATPLYGPGVNLVVQGNVLPTNGSEGIVQTANSLPKGFEQGTVAYAQAKSVQRWVQAHEAATASRVASRSTGSLN